MSRHKSKLGPFVPLLRATLDSAAWRAMSHGSRSLYVALKRRYNSDFRNNGRIYLSIRDASKEIGSGTEEIVRWYRELQHYGFIEMTVPGYLGVEGKGRAPHWRLTEVGYMKDPPTQDFMKWDGTKFKHHRRAARSKTESRTGKAARGVPEGRHTSVTERRHSSGEKRYGMAAHTAGETVPERRYITSLPSVAEAEPERPLQQTPSLSPPPSAQCTYCHGSESAPDNPLTIGAGDIWLHARCRDDWRAERLHTTANSTKPPSPAPLRAGPQPR
jgi:hypothetical protein